MIPTEKTTYSSWLHSDQPRNDKCFICVQGVVLLTDSEENDGGFCFMNLEGKSVEEVNNMMMDRHPTYGIK